MSALLIAEEGVRALAAHKLRTFFMMAGTVLGIASLVVIVAIGKGTEREVMNRVGDFQYNVVKVNAGGGKGYTKPQPDVITLRLEDADEIRKEITAAEIVTSVRQKSGVAMKAGDKQTQASVYAVDADWHEAMKWPAEAGEGITPEDIATMAHVAVLGPRTAKALFTGDDPVGQDILVGSTKFKVKGVLKFKAASPGGEDENARAVIPLSTGMRRFFNEPQLSYIRIRLPEKAVEADASLIPATAERIRQILIQRHHITPPETDDFSIVTAADVAAAARGISGTLTALLMVLAGLGLLVGGLVMMNILLVAVSERTREIGLRRAVGATQGAIFTQFLAESLAVTIFGAILGVVIGWATSVILKNYTALKVETSWEPFVLAAAFALVVGLVFGVLPARRAARLDPVDALR